MRKIMTSVFGAGLLLNLGIAKADFPPNCPNISAMIQMTNGLNKMYGGSQVGQWYRYFQASTQQPDGSFAQITYYNLGAPVSNPVLQTKELEAAFGNPTQIEINPDSPDHPETLYYECVYVGDINPQGYPEDVGSWHQVVTLRYSQHPLMNLYIDTGPDLPPGLLMHLTFTNTGMEPYLGAIMSGRSEYYQLVAEDEYNLVAPTTIQSGGHTYQLILNNPYILEPDTLENGDSLLLNYKQVS